MADDQYAASRAIVAKVQADMWAERLAEASTWLADLQNFNAQAQVEAVAIMLARRHEDQAACDYAETRLSEMRADLKTLAADVSDGAYHTGPFSHEVLADVMREVARG